MRVLVADGSPTMRGIVARGLRQAGADDVVECASLAGARAASGTPFDVAVVARELGEDGDWSWLASFRERACAERRLIVTGRHVTRADVDAIRAAGGGAFLLVPFTPEAVAERAIALLPAGAETDEGDATRRAA